MDSLIFFVTTLFVFSLCSLVVQVLIALFALAFNQRISSFSYLFWSISLTDVNGTGDLKYKLIRSRFSFIGQCIFGPITKRNNEPIDYKTNDKTSFLIYAIAGSIAMVFAGFLFILLAVLLEDSFLKSILTIAVTALGLNGAIHIFSMLVSIIKSRKPSVKAYRSLCNVYRSVPDMSVLEVPPLHEVVKGTSGDATYDFLYQLIRYRIMESKADINELKDIASWLSQYHSASLVPVISFHRDSALMMHYSYWEPDPNRAKVHYESSKGMIDNDKDSNGRRRLAYYSLFVLGDTDLAQRYLEEAISALGSSDPRVTECEKNLERKMLEKLNDALRSKSDS